MATKVLKTKFRTEMEARDSAIYDEWEKLSKQPGTMKMAIYDHLLKKYGLHAKASIWQARDRHRKRLQSLKK